MSLFLQSACGQAPTGLWLSASGISLLKFPMCRITHKLLKMEGLMNSFRFRNKIVLLALTGTLAACLGACSNTADDRYDSSTSTAESAPAESSSESSESSNASTGSTSEETGNSASGQTAEDASGNGSLAAAEDSSENTAAEGTETEDFGTPLPVPDGQYLSELTGLPIDESLKMQRPIAVMIDNESKALPHYNTAGADIVYEMMNSTANDRITRLMCLYKDWEDLPQTGSIRSVRPTNILVAQEYDAVICHDGGPFYINDYFSRYPYHFSGTFSRVDNGKAREFTEYILPGDLDRNFSRSGYSKEYSEESASHFQFAPYGTKTNLDDWDADGIRTARHIELPFYHNRSQLIYNEETRTYDYYEYGKQHLDAGTKAPLSFTNVLLQDCSFHQYDKNGYLIYNCIDKFQFAYYCTEGKNISILWTKEGEDGVTRFFDADGEEIQINPGKTYIGIIPDDTWDEVKIY